MKVYNPQWDRDMNIDEQLAETMKAAGYEPEHTGGGCMAWRRAEKDLYSLITVDLGLGSWEERTEPVWEHGRYRDDEEYATGDAETMLEYSDKLTLQEAIEK